MSLLDLPLRDFVAGLLTDDGAYGGGSVAALAGSLAAGLVTMVGRTTLQGAGGSEARSPWREVTCEAEGLSRRLLARVDDDIEAYEAIVFALRMPDGSARMRDARETAIQRALLQAARVPQQTLLDCVRILGLTDSVARLTRVSLLSDLGSAAFLAHAGARAAALNAEVNARCLPESDEAASFIASCRRSLEVAGSLEASVQQGMADRGADANGNWVGWLSRKGSASPTPGGDP